MRLSIFFLESTFWRTYMDEIRKFGPKRNLHRILRFLQNGSKRNLHTFGENGAKRREKNRIFRHKNEFLKGETWYFRACRAKRGEKILHDFQRFLGPKRNLHGFWKTRILARKGTYIKSRFWILKGGVSFRFCMVVSVFEINTVGKKVSKKAKNQVYSLKNLTYALKWKCYYHWTWLCKNCKKTLNVNKK